MTDDRKDDDRVRLRPRDAFEENLDSLPELRAIAEEIEALQPIAAGGHSDWDEPFELEVVRPRAIDLRKLWQLTGKPEPPGITATLGPRIPILLDHQVTPFPLPGRRSARVWAIGYEIELHGVDANTVNVVPNDEVVEIGKVGQTVEFGLDVGGQIGIPKEALTVPTELAAVSTALTSGSLRASTNQHYQFSLQIRISLRKVVGAGKGIGGAKWTLFRQNERIDRPHTLLQTLVVAGGTTSIPCTVKSWATQAGFFGRPDRTYHYDDRSFDVSLAGM